MMTLVKFSWHQTVSGWWKWYQPRFYHRSIWNLQSFGKMQLTLGWRCLYMSSRSDCSVLDCQIWYIIYLLYHVGPWSRTRSEALGQMLWRPLQRHWSCLTFVSTWHPKVHDACVRPLPRILAKLRLSHASCPHLCCKTEPKVQGLWKTYMYKEHTGESKGLLGLLTPMQLRNAHESNSTKLRIDHILYYIYLN